jgi:hypothetical protein
VSGTVHVDGVPAAHAMVVFHYKDPATKKLTRAGDAFIEADGSFVLSTYAPNDGAPAGEYVVTVAANAGYGKSPNFRVEIPEAYTKPDTSPLTATVKSGPNAVALELKK